QIKDNSLSTTYRNQNLNIKPVKNVEIKLSDSWYSPEYNLKSESKRAEFSKKYTGFTSLISLLYFPEEIDISYKKIPVYNRKNELLTDKDAEAVTLQLKNKEYTLFVAYNSPYIANHFFKVNDFIIHGEVVLLEKEIGGEIEVKVIK
ncbi:MAG: hypothetical protein ABFR05_13655, partial [Bacteroidota bacterium]